jgi:hypothetical protein
MMLHLGNILQLKVMMAVINVRYYNGVFAPVPHATLS